MKDFIAWLIAGIVAVAILMAAIGYNNQSAATRAHAEAAIIRAQAQARLDATSANLPYVVIGVVALMGLCTLTLAGLVLYKWGDSPANQPPHIIETRTIIMLQPGQSRRDLWQTISNAETVKAIPAPTSTRKEQYQ